MTQPPREILEQIADRLSQPIPKPKAAVARTQKTWRTLSLGQKLRLRQRWFRPGLDLPPGTEITISKVDSLGIDLTHHSNSGKITVLRWTNPEWQGMFEKSGRKK